VSEEFGDAFGDEEVQSTNGGHSHAGAQPELVYSSAVEFFAELLAQSYVREVNEGAAFAWCPEWYKHPEALIRWKPFGGPGNTYGWSLLSGSALGG
jgi:Domain of unknown function (DUF4913)